VGACGSGCIDVIRKVKKSRYTGHPSPLAASLTLARGDVYSNRIVVGYHCDYSRFSFACSKEEVVKMRPQTPVRS
jgi:hypothetical protein